MKSRKHVMADRSGAGKRRLRMPGFTGGAALDGVQQGHRSGPLRAVDDRACAIQPQFFAGCSGVFAQSPGALRLWLGGSHGLCPDRPASACIVWVACAALCDRHRASLRKRRTRAGTKSESTTHVLPSGMLLS